MSAQVLAIIYAALTTMPFALQVALAANAPLGRFTMGGRFPDRLPPLWRGLAVVQAALLALMAVVVLDRGTVLSLGLGGVLFWITLALTFLTLLANAASPSLPERRLWTPVTLVMALCIAGVAYLTSL